jgi:SAM-dependent methyltransferase
MLTPPPNPLQGFVRDEYLVTSGVASQLTGLTVLCLGMSEAQIDAWVAPYNPARIVSLTLWENHIDNYGSKYEIIVGDICAITDIPDDTFDAVLTSALFEHLGNINAACAEMTRIAKPEAIIGIEMGPIWSSPVGHHLYMHIGDPYLDFTQRQLPSHFHLVYSLAEMRDLFAEGGHAGQVEAIFDRLYRSRFINRFMWEDYMTAFKRHFTPQFEQVYSSEVPEHLLSLLRHQFSPYKDFESEGGQFVFRTKKPKPPPAKTGIKLLISKVLAPAAG